MTTGNELEQHLLKALTERQDELPTLPEAAAEAMRLAHSPDLDFEEVVRVVERDPTLAARLLSIANSPMYMAAVPITSVKAALVRVGSSTTRDLLYMAVLAAALLDDGRQRARIATIFRHCIVTAQMARRIATRKRLDPDLAFVAGLLHDIGRIRLLRIAATMPDPADPLELTAVIDALHERAGALLSRAWRLPEEIVEACERHHGPEGVPLAEVVSASDLLARRAEDPPRAFDEEVSQGLARIGFPLERMQELVDIATRDCVAVARAI